MTVKEFKEYLDKFSDKSKMHIVIVHWLNTLADDVDIETICNACYYLIKIRKQQKENRCEKLEQQLIQTKMYLKGEMYNDEATAKEMLTKQIENIEDVLNDDK